MSYSLDWLADVLEKAGLKVAPVDEWKTRGRGEIREILGVVCHHTVGPRNGNMPSLNILVRGNASLMGPRAHLGLGRDGTYYVIAAGRANHAGVGEWRGITDANAHYIGIEAENDGMSEEYPEVQMEAYLRGIAAILGHLGLSSAACIGHKEYAPKRKVDPRFNMNDFRAKVQSRMEDKTPPRLIPSREPDRPDDEPRQTIRRGTTPPAPDALVKLVQQAIEADQDGNFGPGTEARVRQFQRDRGLISDGIVGPKTWAAIRNPLK